MPFPDFRNLSTLERTEARIARLLSRPFGQLNEIVAILGTTKAVLYPFLPRTGFDIFPYGAGLLSNKAQTSDAGGTPKIEAEFDPVSLTGGIHAYYFDSSKDNHLKISDSVNFTHGNGSTDTPFSMGMWIMPTAGLSAVQSLMAKYGNTANQEEYDLRFDASGNLVLELHDMSASASETGTGANDVIVPFVWNFIVATYDGAQAAPEVHLYRNGLDTLAAGTTVESGTYTAMENSSADVLVAARDATGAPGQVFEGFLAMPFITGKELTQTDVSALYTIGREMLGLA